MASVVPEDGRVCSMCDNDHVNMTMDINSQMLVGPCGHYYCRHCASTRLFKGARGGLRGARTAALTVPCIVCRAPLRRNDLQAGAVADEVEFQEEKRARRWLRGVFNARREHFDTLQEYNEYLERTEDLLDRHMTAFVSNNADEKHKVELEVAAYQQKNASTISLNESYAAETREATAEQVREAALRRDLETKKHHLEDKERRSKIKLARDKVNEVVGQADSAAEIALNAVATLISGSKASEPEKANKTTASLSAPPLGALVFVSVTDRFRSLRLAIPAGVSTESHRTAVTAGHEDEDADVRSTRRAAGGFDRRVTLARDRLEASTSLFVCAAS